VRNFVMGMLLVGPDVMLRMLASYGRDGIRGAAEPRYGELLRRIRRRPDGPEPG
jgi:hypothetical protein